MAARRQCSDFPTASLDRCQSHIQPLKHICKVINILYSQQEESFIHTGLLRQFLVPFFPAHYNNSTPAAATWPKGAKLARDPLSQHLASKALGKGLSSCAWLPLDPSCGRAADSWGGCSVPRAPFHFNTCLICRNVRTCTARSLHKSCPRPSARAPFVTERTPFLTTTVPSLFFFSFFSPSSSPSHICI